MKKLFCLMTAVIMAVSLMSFHTSAAGSNDPGTLTVIDDGRVLA